MVNGGLAKSLALTDRYDLPLHQARFGGHRLRDEENAGREEERADQNDSAQDPNHLFGPDSVTAVILGR
jgi:hypothetical protein